MLFSNPTVSRVDLERCEISRTSDNALIHLIFDGALFSKK